MYKVFLTLKRWAQASEHPHHTHMHTHTSVNLVKTSTIEIYSCMFYFKISESVPDGCHEWPPEIAKVILHGSKTLL